MKKLMLVAMVMIGLLIVISGCTSQSNQYTPKTGETDEDFKARVGMTKEEAANTKENWKTGKVDPALPALKDSSPIAKVKDSLKTESQTGLSEGYKLIEKPGMDKFINAFYDSNGRVPTLMEMREAGKLLDNPQAAGDFRTSKEDEKNDQLKEESKNKAPIGKHFFAYPTSDLGPGATHPFYKGEEWKDDTFGVNKKIGFTVLGIIGSSSERNIGWSGSSYKVKFDNGVVAKIKIGVFSALKDYHNKIGE